MSNYNDQFCLYTPNSTGIDALLRTSPTGELSGYYGNQSLDSLRKEYPRAEVMRFGKACDLIERATADKFCKGVSEITERQFWDMLEVLPPAKWSRMQDTEAFYVPEHVIGSLVNWYMRIGDRYFTMCNDCTMSPFDVIQSAYDFSIKSAN